MRKPRWLTQDRKREIASYLIKRYGNCCHYCGCDLLPTQAETPFPSAMQTLDHIVPQSAGGQWKIDNLVLACLECNQLRKSTDYEAFKRLRRAARVEAAATKNAEHKPNRR